MHLRLYWPIKLLRLMGFAGQAKVGHQASVLGCTTSQPVMAAVMFPTCTHKLETSNADASHVLCFRRAQVPRCPFRFVKPGGKLIPGVRVRVGHHKQLVSGCSVQCSLGAHMWLPCKSGRGHSDPKWWAGLSRTCKPAKLSEPWPKHPT